MEKPLVSVCLITYNQEKFIRETLDGILKQKTDFLFEVIIGEDCSTDNTRLICDEYIAKFPYKIRPLYHAKNVGMAQNWILTMKACKGKYIAICEGDDYWTDPLKLQKQADLMEAHPEYSMCAHNADILEYGNLKKLPPINSTELDINDIIQKDWGIMTASIMFRSDELPIPKWYGRIKNCDYALQLLMGTKGKMGILPDVMSVYRKHEAGISSTLRPLSQASWIIYLLFEFDKYTDKKYHREIIGKIKRIYRNQTGFAQEYNLKKATAVLRFYRMFVPIAPFAIRKLRS